MSAVIHTQNRDINNVPTCYIIILHLLDLPKESFGFALVHLIHIKNCLQSLPMPI